METIAESLSSGVPGQVEGQRSYFVVYGVTLYG